MKRTEQELIALVTQAALIASKGLAKVFPEACVDVSTAGDKSIVGPIAAAVFNHLVNLVE